MSRENGLKWILILVNGASLVLTPSLAEAKFALIQTRPDVATFNLATIEWIKPNLVHLDPRIIAQSPQKARADTLIRQGVEAAVAGQLQVSVQAWQQALDLYHQIRDRKGELIASQNLAKAYAQLSQPKLAIQVIQPALKIVRELGDRATEQELLRTLGNAYFSLRNYPEAISALKTAANLAEQLGDRQSQMQVLGALAWSYRDAGDYNRATRTIQRTYTLARELKNSAAEIEALSTLGQIYYRVGLYTGAAAAYSGALEVARPLSTPKLTGLLLNLGAAEYKRGNFEAAIQVYQEGLQLAETQGSLGDVGKFSGNLGLAELGRGDSDRALKLVQKDVEIARQLQDAATEGEALSFLGDIQFARQAYPQALGYYQQSLTILRRFNAQRRLSLLQRKIGVVLREQGKLRDSEQSLRAAIATGEAQRKLAQGDDILNTASFDSLDDAYGELQTTLIAQKRYEDALEASEQGRARAFADLISKRNGRLPNTTALTIGQIRQVAKRLNATLVQYAIRENALDKLTPSALVREEELYIWVVSPTGSISFRQVDLRPLWKQPVVTLSGLVGSVRCFGSLTCIQRLVQANRTVGNANPETESVAYNAQSVTSSDSRNSKISALQQLYEVLIQPIQEFLPKDPTERVIFMPDTVLYRVPFGALADAKGQFLIEQHPILSAPSAQILALVGQRPSARPLATGDDALIVGNPTMPSVPPQVGAAPRPLAPLPSAELEAKEISTLLATSSLIGDAARKSSVIKQMANAHLIHLATHGLLYQNNVITGIPGALALAPNPNLNQDAQPDDNYGLLTANEIINLNLTADLVVLSACDTGLGRVSGDGVAGLSRAFLAAGVPSVLVSLWKVPDAPTSELMIAFYQNLKNNVHDPAQALQQAMLTLQKKYPNPLDWAAFVLMGTAQ